MNINAAWHQHHKMPNHPTLDQRVKWHLDHVRHCSCRPPSGEILAEMEKRYLGKHQDFWLFCNREDHKLLALWAADCATHVLSYFNDNYPADPRPDEAIHALQNWVDTDQFSMPLIRAASLGAHQAAKTVKPEDQAAVCAAHAAGQAVATAHAPTHAFGAMIYALKAVAAAHPDDPQTAVIAEKKWQQARLPQTLQRWAALWDAKLQRLLPTNLRHWLS